MKQALQNLLAEGKIAQVIAQLRQVTQKDADLYNQVLLISARFTENERQRHANTLDNSSLDIQQNKINAALLAVIEHVGETEHVVGTSEASTTAHTTQATTVQNADKIYNIEHIDNANFS